MSAKIAPPKTVAQSRKVPALAKTKAKKPPVASATVPKAPVKTSAQEMKAQKIKHGSNKVKVVRDSFTMPKNDYAKIGELKQLCLDNSMRVKKSELLRAGLHALGKLSISQLKTALSSLEKVETGRPKKSEHKK